MRNRDIKNELSKRGIRLSDQGLSKVLHRLIALLLIEEFLDEGVKKYRLTEGGQNYLDKYYWPLLDELNAMKKDEWLMRTFDNYTDVYQVMMKANALNQRVFYIVPLPMEIHAFFLTYLADKIVNGELMDERTDEHSDIFIIMKIKLEEVERLAAAFSEIWNTNEISIDHLYDIISNLIAKKPPYMQRIIVVSLAAMFVVGMQSLTKEQRKRMRELDRKLGEILFQRLKLTSDLDDKVIEIFIEDLEKGEDPLMDKRLEGMLIRFWDTPDGKVPMYSNLTLDYINAAVLKKHTPEFTQKVLNYIKGTQGLLLRTTRYEIRNVSRK